MGYAAVASLSQTIDIILNYHQDYTIPHFQNQIISLRKHSVFLQSFIEDDPDRANNWGETIREVTDRAEEIVELLLSDLLLESKSESKSDYDSDELERVTEEMESVAYRVKVRRHTEVAVGSDEELMEIISRVHEDSSALKIIPIVGIGGMGKATLARNAYNHPSIGEHFGLRAWSTISQEYSLRRTILDLLRCMNKSSHVRISDSEDELISNVYKLFRGKRFLIVLDDVWSFEALERIKTMLPDDGNGSRIILTTRLSNVASVAGTHIHEMRFLNEDRSWDLVREKIFKGDPCPSQLERIGKEIARSCRGHLLSIEVVSGILAAADQTEAAWKDVLENMKINDFEDYILLRIISLSYTYLPHHLRPCLLYLAIFPSGGGEINVSKLIKLWVAEGFLKQSEFKSFEATGEEHVEDLVQRGLVSVSSRRFNGRIKSITIDDVVRDWCEKQVQVDNFVLYLYDDNAMKLQSCRRVSTSTYNYDILEGVCGSTTRTLMINCYNSELDIVRWRIRNVRLLRILDLSNAYHFDLPDDVFELFHLRYLAFHCGFSISEAISNLQNLQTLIILSRKRMSKKFGKLPDGIWRMPQLRHLYLSCFKVPSHQIRATSALEDLQTLSGVVDFICSRENLEVISNLRKLALLYTKKFRDVKEEDLKLHNLIYLHKLESLKIDMDWSSLWKEHEMSTRCAFPPTLQKLNLCGVQLPWEDMKIVGSLPNLQVLKLRKNACIGETWETSEGGFSKLTYLLIEECNLEKWITESDHFPTLKCLVLRCCLRLLEVPEEVAEFYSLEVIELDERNPSLLSSVKRIQEERESWGDGLQIRLV